MRRRGIAAVRTTFSTRAAACCRDDEEIVLCGFIPGSPLMARRVGNKSARPARSAG
jgi:hypothetical protein